MEEESKTIDSLLNKTIAIVEKLEQKAKMFGNGMLILSFLDCLFGILAIFCTSLTLTAFFASATSLTAITLCGRIIQISKVRQLEKALKPINAVAIAWFVNRYKKLLNKGEKKMKMTKSTVLQKVLTTILSIFGIGGIVVAFLPQFLPIATQITNIVAMVSECIAVVSGIWLSATNDKVLTADEIAKLTAEKEKKENAIKQKKVAKAKAELERIENLKKIVADAEQNK